jgi:aspartate aminotransferase
MTGWRLGYAACPEFEIIKKMDILQQQSISNPVTFAQYGAIASFTDEAKLEMHKMRDSFKERRDYSMKRLNEFNCTCIKPGGAFYLFPYFEGQNDVDLANSMLEAGVGTVPGSPFGTQGRSCIRISYGNADIETLGTAFDRMSSVKGII